MKGGHTVGANTNHKISVDDLQESDVNELPKVNPKEEERIFTPPAEILKYQ